MWNVTPDNGLLLAACSAFIPTISGQTSARVCRRSRWRRWAKRKSWVCWWFVPWLRSCTQWERIHISAAQCESHYRPPTFMALVERCRASRGESWLERSLPPPPTPHPPLVLLAARSRWRRSTAPTLLASLCQVLQLESSWADRGYMVLQQPSRLKTPTEGSLPLLYSKGKLLQPPLTILLSSRKNLTSQMELLWNLLGLFDKFSW